MTHGEGAIGELKLRHGLARARRRGTSALQLQALVAATAINLKRLLNGPQAADNSARGDSRTRARILRTVITRCAHRLTLPAASAPLTSLTAS